MQEKEIKFKVARRKTSLENYTNICRICERPLGFFIDSKNSTQEVYSGVSLKIDDKEFKRAMCADCFLERYGRLPRGNGNFSKDIQILLNIDDEYFKKHTSRIAVSRNNMIKKYGEVEGQKKWDSYVERQRYTNSFEYKREKYGWDKEDFDYYNEMRSSTKKNFCKRYGNEEGLKKWNSYVERQRYTKSLERYIDELGEVDGKKKFDNINKRKKHNLINYVNKFGEVEGKKKFKKYLKNIKNNHLYSSKIANDFFDMIYNGDAHVYYSRLNKEFFKYSVEMKRGFFYDYVDTKRKKCIEFNGDVYHANPNLFQKTEKPLFWLKDFRTSEEIWEQDERKREVIRKHGYDVLVVWEYDFRRNPEEVIKSSKIFLYGEGEYTYGNYEFELF